MIFGKHYSWHFCFLCCATWLLRNAVFATWFLTCGFAAQLLTRAVLLQILIAFIVAATACFLKSMVLLYDVWQVWLCFLSFSWCSFLFYFVFSFVDVLSFMAYLLRSVELCFFQNILHILPLQPNSPEWLKRCSKTVSCRSSSADKGDESQLLAE